MGLITIDYRDRKLIYEQLVDNVKLLVLRGDLKKNDFLPSVRSLAKELGINPNTIQKAYHMLEEEEIILSRAGAKSCVTIDADKIAKIRRELLRKETEAWVAAMKQMKVSQEEAEELVKEIWEEIG